MSDRFRPAPDRVLIFGASSHLGGPLAEEISARNEAVTLRLVTSSDDKVAGLAERFPDAEVVVANYLDLSSLIRAFDDVDAAFVTAPDFQFNERQVASNVAAAAWSSRRQPHLVNVTGISPGTNYANELRTAMRENDGPALKYQEWKAVLTSSGLPVSFLNSWAYFMDDLLSLWFQQVVTRQVFAAPYDRVTTFIDTRDLGAAAATLLLAPHDRDHDGIVHMCTGTERIRLSDIPTLLTEILGVAIGYEDDPQGWADEVREGCDGHFGAVATDYLLKFFRNEQRDEPLFIVTDVLPHLLGRTPRGLREWIEEHASAYFVEGTPLAKLATARSAS